MLNADKFLWISQSIMTGAYFLYLYQIFTFTIVIRIANSIGDN